MKTIEQYEAEISQKSQLIDGQMEAFKANIGRIGQVIGKDATEVYDKLTYHYNAVVNDMSTTTRRNAEIMESWVRTLDSILVVLGDVMIAIETMETPAENRDMLDIRSTVDQALDQAAEKAEQMVVEATGVEVDDGIFRYAITGLGSWFILGLLGIRGAARLGASVAAAWWLGKQA